MSRKRITIEKIRNFMLSYGYVLKSKEYKYNVKLEIQCPNDHIFKTNWSNFQQGRRCRKCSNSRTSKRLTLSYETIKDYIESFEYKLISDEYLDAHSKLTIECTEGHNYKVKWNNFQQGGRCPECRKNNRSLSHKHIKNKHDSLVMLEYIINYLQQFDYKFIYGEYKNSKSKLKIQCDKSHIYETTWDNIKYGNRCIVCYHDSLRMSLDYIKDYLQQFDYKFISGEYKNSKSKLLVQCGKSHIYETTWQSIQSGRRCTKCPIKRSDETRKKLSESHKGRFIGKDSPCWKGGGLTSSFNTYSDKLFFEEVRCVENDILEVRCTYCNKWHRPTRLNACNRINGVKGSVSGENRFYCSNGCKKSCEIYGQRKYPKGHRANKYTREVQPALRKLVLERDNWICQKCNSDNNLHCHHYEGVEINPIESADVDNCVALCKKCHKAVHKQNNCDMKRRKCES
jgi:hypothetical protein